MPDETTPSDDLTLYRDEALLNGIFVARMVLVAGALLVAPGDDVQEGDPLLVIVAMKMNNEVRSPAAGRITDVAVSAGDAVEQGSLMLTIDTETDA